MFKFADNRNYPNTFPSVKNQNHSFFLAVLGICSGNSDRNLSNSISDKIIIIFYLSLLIDV